MGDSISVCSQDTGCGAWGLCLLAVLNLDATGGVLLECGLLVFSTRLLTWVEQRREFRLAGVWSEELAKVIGGQAAAT